VLAAPAPRTTLSCAAARVRAAAPGTYVLHHIKPRRRARCSASTGARAARALYAWQITLLGFIYTTCSDPKDARSLSGVSDALKEAIALEPSCTASGSSRFVRSGARHAGADEPLRRQPRGSTRARPALVFLLRARRASLLPLVEASGRMWRVTRNGRELSHVLKVFLRPRRRRGARSTVQLLHPEVVLNDIETLLAEER